MERQRESSTRLLQVFIDLGLDSTASQPLIASELCTVHRRQRPARARSELRLRLLQSEPPLSPSRLSLNPAAACPPCLTLLPARLCLGRRPTTVPAQLATALALFYILQVGIHLTCIDR